VQTALVLVNNLLPLGSQSDMHAATACFLPFGFGVSPSGRGNTEKPPGNQKVPSFRARKRRFDGRTPPKRDAHTPSFALLVPLMFSKL